MKRYCDILSVLSILFIILLAISGCDKDIELTDKDNGEEISIENGDTFTVTLESNPTTGFGWENVTTGEHVVQVGESTYKQSRSCQGTGCGGEETFTFKGVSDGKTVVTLAYSRPWESVPPEKTFEVTVTVGTGNSQHQDDVNEEKSDKDRDMDPEISDADIDALVGGNTDFALSLYQQLIQDQDGNLFYSPFSVSAAFAMLYAGARGETEAQMAAALNFSLPRETLHTGFNYLDIELHGRGQGAAGSDGGDFRLKISNAVWVDEALHLLDDYMDILAVNYGAGLHTLDFATSPEDSRQTINKWVAEQTENKIKELIPEGSITEIVRMVLTNTIYFNAAWEKPFEEYMTSDDSFYLLDGSEISVPIMRQTELLGYVDGDNYQAVTLPYDGNDVAMLIILPDAGEFAAVESALKIELLSSIKSHTKMADIQLSMPKWENRTKLALADILEAMGMPDAFNFNNADFSGITGTPELFVQDVFHQAYVKVDESGTEAAAATAPVEVPTSEPPTPIDVKVNRPFIYLIQDIKTRTVLFVGRVLDPTT